VSAQSEEAAEVDRLLVAGDVLAMDLVDRAAGDRVVRLVLDHQAPRRAQRAALVPISEHRR
jgi:hypothetical protein